MKKYDYLVAIDPDTEKSGVATLRTEDKHIECETRTFPKLIDYFHFLNSVLVAKDEAKVLILVEAGWLNQSNWHLGKFDSKQMAASKGSSVGRNQETGRKIIEMARHYGLEVQEVRPLKKCWHGPDGKISHEELAYFVPGLPARTNQEIRDSVLLAWNYAGFPMKIRCKINKELFK